MIDKVLWNQSEMYMLSDTNSKGEPRRSELIKGNLKLYSQRVDDVKRLGFKFYQTTFVFRDNKTFEELGGEEMQGKLIDTIKETLLRDMNMDKVSVLFVRHFPLVTTEENGVKATKIGYELNVMVPQIVDDTHFRVYEHNAGGLELRQDMEMVLHLENPEFTNPNAHKNYVSYKKNKDIDSNLASSIAYDANNIIEEFKESIKTKADITSKLEENGYEALLKEGYISVKTHAPNIRYRRLPKDILDASCDKTSLEKLDKASDLYKASQVLLENKSSISTVDNAISYLKESGFKACLKGHRIAVESDSPKSTFRRIPKNLMSDDFDAKSIEKYPKLCEACLAIREHKDKLKSNSNIVGFLRTSGYDVNEQESFIDIRPRRNIKDEEEKKEDISNNNSIN